jgi:hypothetical protein
MELNLWHQTFFLCDGKQNTDGILGLNALPRSPAGPGVPVIGHRWSFCSGKEGESHSHGSQGSVPPRQSLPSITFNSCHGTEWQIKARWYPTANPEQLMPPQNPPACLQRTFLPCRSLKVFPSLQIASIKTFIFVHTMETNPLNKWKRGQKGEN